MTQKTTKNGVIDQDTLRISFLLNVKHYPELAYLMALEGHGDRPRELIRLAVSGATNEAHLREITDAVRASEIRKVASGVVASERRVPAPAGDPALIASENIQREAQNPSALAAARGAQAEEGESDGEVATAAEPASQPVKKPSSKKALRTPAFLA